MASSERTFSLHVPASTENLAMIRQFVTSIAGQAGFDADETARLELAVDEACANAIEHACGHDPSQDVGVRARIDADELHITVMDTGSGFDPSAAGQASVERLVAEQQTGGLGMQVIRQVMDKVSYETIPGERNELRMVKRIRR